MSDKEYEVWENTSAGKVKVVKSDRRGELQSVLLRSGQRVSITTDDRVLNQDMSAKKENDVFSNGRLSPIRLIDDASDAKEVASNPNLLSEEDMRGLFKENWKTFDKRISDINSPVALSRLIQVANDEDATVRQVEKVKARLNEVAPSEVQEIQSDPSNYDEGKRIGPQATRPEDDVKFTSKEL